MKKIIKFSKKTVIKTTLFWRGKPIWEGNYWEIHNKEGEWMKKIKLFPPKNNKW